LKFNYSKDAMCKRLNKNKFVSWSGNSLLLYLHNSIITILWEHLIQKEVF